MENKEKQPNKLKLLARYYKPYKGLFLADLFFAILGAAVTLVIPLLVRYIMNTIGNMPISEAKSAILTIGAGMLGLILVQLGSRYFITYYGHMMGAYIEHDMRNEIFSHYQKLSFTFYDNQKVGHLLSRITSDLFDISELLHHGPEDIIISVIKLVGAFLILVNVNGKMAAISFSIVIVMLFYALIFNRRMKHAFKENRARIADINSQIEDSLSGIRVVKSFGNEKREMEKFAKGNERFVAAKRLSYRYMAGYHAGMDSFTTLITVASLVAGAFFLTDGTLDAADLVTFLLYINNFTEPVTKLVNFTEQFQNGYSGYDRFLEMMAIAPDIEDAPDAVSLDKAQGGIEFQEVSFHYSDTNEEVLSHVNLKVNPGDYVALVGTSGAGKTTLCSLIPRFYDVSSGKILLDGTDIRKIKLKDLRRQIGIVQQDVYLFAGTIMENIRYGKPDATDEEVIRAAKAANAHDFIMEMPADYDTDIGQRGVKLSGGQKQRLSIARAFLKNPPILIFDEATSALDNESEKVVQESLEKLAKDRTTFVIAHRLSTIRNARRILVLTEDGIAEEGTHDELLKKTAFMQSFVRQGFEKGVIMKEIKTENAVGHILCHDITEIVKDERKGVLFHKGHVVREEDIPALLRVGKEHLYVWEKKPGILHENEGAEILRQISQGEGMHPTEPKEGKIELIADRDGLLKIRRDALKAVNSLGEMMIASRHGDFPVKKGQKIAGTRIIPLVIEEEKMKAAKETAGQKPIFDILAFHHKKAGIVTTGSEVKKGLIQDTFTPVLEEKLKEYDAEILGHTTPGDEKEQITKDILTFIENGADLVLCSGGMSVDPDDRTPGAIKDTGAEVLTYGAPVLPGAMLMVAYYKKDGKKIPIIGLPGCVMYAKRTVFDLILPRIMADDKILSEEIAAYGEGGLCLNCETCTFPNCGFGK